ncbi:hypothetical protein KO566_01245 [Flavobacteriaceae bacterium XHP0103]|uniref:DUF6427 family protein n=1 Tax=Marixanthotalea marina TaxID=2844359 RepID=UPI002989B73E|nr:DUF6427 family protein [Marixanthotalea marina]MBU3820670.1 hypothetical protein [Marixanthotalea marina]
MITSIFNKSKPINFVIVFFITLLAFLTARLGMPIELTASYIFKQIGLFLFCYMSILVVNFIVSKHSLTKKSNYEILLFSLFLLAINQTTTNTNILFSNFFILLALRRIISLRSFISPDKKLFDAAFWIGIATLFFFWSSLFFVLIFIALLLYTDNKVKHWIIPFVGILTVFIIAISVSVLVNGDFFSVFKSLPDVSYDFNNYNTAQFLIATTMLFSFGLWASLFYVKSLKGKKKAFRPSFKIVLFAVLIAFIIAVLAPNKTGAEFLFLFAPLAIIITNYIETIQEKWFREIFVLTLIIVPFILLFL